MLCKSTRNEIEPQQIYECSQQRTLKHSCLQHHFSFTRCTWVSQVSLSFFLHLL